MPKTIEAIMSEHPEVQSIADAIQLYGGELADE